MRQTDAGHATIYTYDAENRLLSTQSPTNTTAYSYDADGIRVRSVVNGAVTDYVVDTNRDFAQVLEERDSNRALIVRYIHGHDLISQERNGATFYYHADGLGSTRVLTDRNGRITDTYTYEAFGNLLSSSGSTDNTFLFTGEQFDPNVGFYYLRARHYHPELGRFPHVDPLEGNIYDPRSLHKYTYAHLDPVNNIDPSGLISLIQQVAVTTSLGSLSRIVVTVPHHLTTRTLLHSQRLLSLTGDAAIQAWERIHRVSLGLQVLLAGPAVRWWGVTGKGINQGIRHFYQYWHRSDKIQSHFVYVARLLNRPLSDFAYSRIGFENYTEAALGVAHTARLARPLSNGRAALFLEIREIIPGIDGILVLVQNGRLQTMFATTIKYYNDLN